MKALIPKRLGVLLPSSNTVVEPEMGKILSADASVTAHFSRLRVVQISGDASSVQQFETTRILQAAELLADAQADLILWNGTAGSWLGFEYDRKIEMEIELHTGIPSTTAITAVNDKLSRLGAQKIGLVTPYVEGLEARIIENYRGIGIEVSASARLDLTDNTEYAKITPSEILQMARDVARVPVDAVLILCTNLAGSSIAHAAISELGVPVVDSVRVATEYALNWLSEGRPERSCGSR